LSTLRAHYSQATSENVSPNWREMHSNWPETSLGGRRAAMFVLLAQKPQLQSPHTSPKLWPKAERTFSPALLSPSSSSFHFDTHKTRTPTRPIRIKRDLPFFTCRHKGQLEASQTDRQTDRQSLREEGALLHPQLFAQLLRSLLFIEEKSAIRSSTNH